MNIEQYQTLIDLHHNRYTDSLIDEFPYIFNRILSFAERDTLVYLINGLSINQTAKKRKCKISTIQRIIYEIKYKYRNGLGKRVEASLRQKQFYAQKKAQIQKI